MSESGLDELFRGLDQIEDLPGLYRPITLNMVGLVMKRMPDYHVKDPSRLIELYLHHCLASGVSRDLVRGVFAHMITAKGTKEPRSRDELSSRLRLETWKIDSTLSEMESAGLIRCINRDSGLWEISHDFLARQIKHLLSSLRQPRLERYAFPALGITMVSWSVTIAVAVLVVWPDLKEQKALNELTQLGFSMATKPESYALILQRPDALTDTGFTQFGQLVAELLEPVVELDLESAGITDLSPLQGMPLTYLDLSWADVTDLTPLQGMPLTHLDLGWADVTDLTPLQGMPLTYLDLTSAEGIKDLTPLQGMPLTYLDLTSAEGIKDLTPLQGMPLTYLDLSGTDVTDLSPLQGMPLTYLDLPSADVTDLSPLQGMPLTRLDLSWADVTDLTPLQGMPLTYLDLGWAEGIKDYRASIWMRAARQSG